MNKKLRVEIIKSKIRRIIDLLEIIGENLPERYEDFKKSRITRDAVYKEIETAIECVLDICNIINSDLGLGMPETEESILDNLLRKEVLSKQAVQLIKDMKSFRNILVHKYGEIEDEQAFETIGGGLEDFNKIIIEIEKFLS
ncbi:MAG TPA: DUF86 domain-containing protein [Candidatus Nanoarchaeia archaeon]|nr:DUF86 domain-containing protein [Candidatus Nanoarchaeia archaeon]